MTIDNDLWHALYQDASKQAESYRLLAHRKELRVIALESQRRTLLSQLRQCAVDLKSRGSIEVADRYLSTVTELEAGYVEQGKGTIQPTGAVAAAPSNGSSNQTGSGRIPEASTQLESPQRLSVLNCAPIAYAGEWDK
jgi:hypothetical protein